MLEEIECGMLFLPLAQPLRSYLDAAVVQVSKAVRNSRH